MNFNLLPLIVFWGVLAIAVAGAVRLAEDRRQQ